MMRTRRFFAFVCLIVVLATSRDARADTSAAVYDDLKDIVAKLIEHRVANGAADFIERASPALRFYLRRTIDRVRKDQWSALRAALVADLSDIVGDYALWALVQNDGKPSFKRFLGCFEPMVVGEQPRGYYCEALRRSAETRSSTLFHARCEAAKPEKFDGQELACGTAAIGRAAIQGRQDDARTEIASLMTTLSSFLSPSYERGRLADSEGTHGHHSTAARLLAEFARGQVLTPLANRNPKDLSDYLAECVGRATARGFRAHNFPSGVVKQVADAKTPEEAQQALLCLNAWVPFSYEASSHIESRPSRPFTISDKVAESFESEYDAAIAAAKVAPGTKVSVRWGRMRWTSADGKAWAPEPGTPPLEAIAKIRAAIEKQAAHRNKLVEEIEGRLAKQAAIGHYKCDGNCPFELVQLGAELSVLRGRAEESSGPMRLASDVSAALRFLRGHIDDVSEVRAVYAAVGRGDTEPVLRVIDALSAVDATQGPLATVPALIRGIVQGDRAEIATATLQAAFADVIDADGGQRGTETDRLFGAFVVNFVNYIVADAEGSPTETARDGFRVSAARLIDGLSSSDGYFKRGIVVYPVVSLRFSWNPGYLSATSGDGFRYIASVDWPAVRTRFGSYVALQMSLLDIAAPLAEFALRKPVSYDNQALVLIDMIRPRLSLLFGIPQLTKNVVATVGISARLLAVCNTGKGKPCDPPTGPETQDGLIYRTTLSQTTANNQIPEVNLGLSYVF